ncbi:MAG TPA: hypothetical protein VK988_06590 [Acidimicrobiales bacterium]|nr:hypothetical protein [Acidimicrobiales bacterium]
MRPKDAVSSPPTVVPNSARPLHVPSLALAVTLGLLLSISPSAAAPDVGHSHRAATITMYGQPNTFSNWPGDTDRHGRTFRTVGIESWRPRPGQSMWPSEAIGGELITGGYAQSSNSLTPTADHMAIGVFNPAKGAYRDIVIPTSNGSIRAVNPYDGVTGGAVVSDFVSLNDAGIEKVAFTSDVNYHRWSVPEYGLYPSLGFLTRDAHGEWQYNRTLSRTAQQLQDQNGALGQTIFPTTNDPYAISQTAFNGGMGSLAYLPASGHLVIARYLDRSFVVLALDGTIKGYYQNNVPDPTGGTWEPAPKWVEADPSSTVGEERFFVQYDAYYTKDGRTSYHYPHQEFRFDSTQPDPMRAITPVTGGMNTDASGIRYGYGYYDAAGNLWTAGDRIGVFVKNQATGKRSLETSCTPPADYPSSGWMTTCGTREVLLEEGYDIRRDGYVQAFHEDTATGTMLVSTSGGKVIPVDTTYAGGDLVAIAARPLIDLQYLLLSATQEPPRHSSVAESRIDVATRSLWTPIRSLIKGYKTQPPEVLHGWASRIDLDLLTKEVPAKKVGTRPAPAAPG